MTKIHVKQQAGMKGKIVALATIGAVVALSIVAASLWVPQGPITFDEERYVKVRVYTRISLCM